MVKYEGAIKYVRSIFILRQKMPRRLSFYNVRVLHTRKKYFYGHFHHQQHFKLSIIIKKHYSKIIVCVNNPINYLGLCAGNLFSKEIKILLTKLDQASLSKHEGFITHWPCSSIGVAEFVR